MRIAEYSSDDYMFSMADVVEYTISIQEYWNMNDELNLVLVNVFVDNVWDEGNAFTI